MAVGRNGNRGGGDLIAGIVAHEDRDANGSGSAAKRDCRNQAQRNSSICAVGIVEREQIRRGVAGFERHHGFLSIGIIAIDGEAAGAGA